MQRYADARGVSLAPHGKTTMTPWIFQAQQRAGAWGIGVGSAWQASAAMASGVERVLMVNQLVGRANMQAVSRLKAHYRTAEFICCIDSLANARALSTFFDERRQTLDVLIELGVAGGRCGCRSVEDALALAQAAAELPGLRLRGLELYEGVLHGDDPQPQVEALLRQAAGLACRMEHLVEGEFVRPEPVPSGTTWCAISGWRRRNRRAAESLSAPGAISPTTAGSTISRRKHWWPAIRSPAIWAVI